MPTFDDIDGSVSLPQSDAMSGTTLAIQASAGDASQIEAAESRLSRSVAGTASVYSAYAFAANKNVTFVDTPSLTLTLPTKISTTNQNFYVAILQSVSGAQQFITVGPGTVSGRQVAFAPAQTPLPFTNGRTYLYVFYSTSVPATQNAYVSDGSAIKVFPLGANGNVAPTRVIAGAATGLTTIDGITVDAQGNLYVADGGSATVPGSVRVFASGANGNVAPARVLSGIQTQIQEAIAIAVDTDGTLYVATRTPLGAASPSASLLKFAPGATGTAAPTATLASENVYSLALDSTGTNLVFSGNGVTCCSEDTGLTPRSLAATDPQQLIYKAFVGGVADEPATASYYIVASLGEADGTSNVERLAENTSGLLMYGEAHYYITPAPLAQLTLNCSLDGIAVDAASELVTTCASTSTVSVYAPDQNGSPTPIRTIAGSATTLVSPTYVATGF